MLKICNASIKSSCCFFMHPKVESWITTINAVAAMMIMV
nr:MAG TPA: hypothetical protein [Bacteriophage sp.]